MYLLYGTPLLYRTVYFPDVMDHTMPTRVAGSFNEMALVCTERSGVVCTERSGVVCTERSGVIGKPHVHIGKV